MSAKINSDDDLDVYTTMINVFIKYYNISHNTKGTLFDGICDENECNEIMDTFYEIITEFKESNDEKKIYFPDEFSNIDNLGELYCLEVDYNIICVCELLFPLIQYVAMNFRCDDNWSIRPIGDTH